jgi:hypothetical protein
MAKRRPWFTKPAGVFVQLVSAVVLVVGLVMIAARPAPGALVLALGIFGMWAGRQNAASERR